MDLCNPHTLIAFHHAGGSPATFLPWRRMLSPRVQLVSATLPAQPESEPCTEREIELLVSRIGQEIAPWTSAPYTIYGHSMGATVGLALSLHQAANGLPAPRELLVGAAAAPDSPIDGLTAAVIARSGRAAAEFAGSAVAEIKQRQLDADLRTLAALRNYCTKKFRSPVDFPIHVFVGDRDPLRHLAIANRWSKYTSNSCTAETVEGDHYFHREPGFVRRINGFFAELTAADR
ncbi:alpha/beta fold hydrolase [Amycolatopsis ultiminotia]|uniref:Alpha/beta fold hydrolase n=1 Tax=Amycolatopsis ultiminotia TaxID=543629 RepID=A0ABP6VM88_9PSEU